MKLIIVESGDQLGKNSLIKGICEYYNYDNITIRHFGKPPKDLNPEESLDYQFRCFYSEGNFVRHIYDRFRDKNYYDETIIWNRSHLGEYVYAQMFRGVDKNLLKTKLLFFEKHFLNFGDIYLITLTSNPDFFLDKEDGNSFSKNLEQKTKELELFKEIHEFSSIPKKIIIKVDISYIKTEWPSAMVTSNKEPIGGFRLKEDIFQEAIKFINK